ncbi:ubiquinol-cytochrome-c reductase complex assembly factor 1 isoform X1 [Ananas comosus]|uniref:Ubiquinol-cytochrome-c reductase complex assembly factor 1 isoform X1 n=1 Tax=Ananas comosus TaxID=4615 RepID=A0A6P5FEH2_ANACO|nr:ubiquinol-cytochrome-c reductase complex assembly factor 1 isoform X1 [Ananas comosus]
MFPRWGRAVSDLSSTLAWHKRSAIPAEALFFDRSFAKAAAAAPAPSNSPPPPPPPPPPKRVHDKPEVKLNALFWSKPCSLALVRDSPLRVEEPRFEGIRRIIFKLLLFYSKQSKSIRGANVVYRRVISQVDKPAIYDVFQLEKTFKTTFSLLVLHMWLVLRRLKEDGKEGVQFGQYLYEIYNHDLELRVSKAGVNLLLIKWMKELEKIFYGNIVAYDAAMKPEARHDDLANAIWRQIIRSMVPQIRGSAYKGVEAPQIRGSAYKGVEMRHVLAMSVLWNIYFFSENHGIYVAFEFMMNKR